MYSIIRMWQNGARRVINTGLTLEQAQEHCKDPQSSSRTCTTKEGRQRTRRTGAWFDGYTDEPNPKGRRRQH